MKKAKKKVAEKRVTPVIVRGAGRTAPPKMTAREQTNLMVDTFNVVHARIALNDGISLSQDFGLTRERLFEVIGTQGWERTLVILASCARLFVEVPSPVPPFSHHTRDLMHDLAKTLDAKALVIRHVDKEATKGHHI